MSVQIIKWIILLFVMGNCLSETCKANGTDEECLLTQASITIINPADNILDSLVSFLHFNVGDLAEETIHTTLDKKAFIRLFIHLRHNNIQSTAEESLHTCISRRPAFTGPDHTDYYIYTLQKIII